MALPTYQTGTVSVAGGGTVVTLIGGLWSGINAKQGDFISIDGLPEVLITEVTDATHLKIAPWGGAAKTNVPYAIFQNYVGRVVGVAAAEDVGEMLEKLHVDGLPFIVGPDEDVPDPSYGDDGQMAFKPTTGQWWTKTGGVWVPSGGIGDIPEAPIDGVQYGRQDAAWTPIIIAEADFIQAGTGAVTRTMQDKVRETVSVEDFGAVGDGATDDTAAIAKAIASLPADGGIVLFACKNYKVSSTLQIGNGTTTTPSTRRGVILRGMGIPNSTNYVPGLEGYIGAVGPKLTWAGSGVGTPMISVNGPVQGWGIQNLYLEGSLVVGAIGIRVMAGMFGDCDNLTIQNFKHSIVETAPKLSGFAGAGLGTVNSFRNSWSNIFVLTPQVADAVGIILSGDADGQSNTCYDVFNNLLLRCVGGAANTVGLHLAVCDSNVFNNVSIANYATGLLFDYTAHAVFPLGNMFFGYEIGGTSQAYYNAGVPGAGTALNRFYGLNQTNGATAPTLANTDAVDGPWVSYTPTVSFASGSGTATGRFRRFSKTVHLQVTVTCAAGGALTNFGLPAAASANHHSLVGRELAATGQMWVGTIVAGGAVGMAVNYLNNGTMTAGMVLVLSGTYEAA